MQERLLLSGNEAIACGALDAAVTLGTGYPGTPSTEILENFSAFGGRAQWSPNEKIALEVGIGAAFAGARVLTTMKHVGLNVAADPLFTIAYSGIDGGLVIVSADDPGMASSQNEQDNRRYAAAAGVPMLEVADSQEAYDFTRLAFELSERFGQVFMLRVTTRICHSKCIVKRSAPVSAPEPEFVRDIKKRVMVPAYARPAHRNMRAKLAEIAEYNESSDLNFAVMRGTDLGIITSGISFQHCMDASADASVLKLGTTYPLPMKKIADFAAKVKRCLVIEEGDPVLLEAVRAAGIKAEGKAEMYRFGELDVKRVRRIINDDLSAEATPAKGKAPQLCPGCPHRSTFEILRDMNCIVSGDIGCYTLGVLPPFEAMDTCVCMGASIGVALGLRHVLPRDEAKRVVSVIGDSTFMHSGIGGLVDMVYNRPATGHLVLVLDNSTTAMTGLQEHPGTGRSLDHTAAPQVSIENVAKAIGVDNVDVCDPVTEKEKFKALIAQRLQSDDLSVIVARRECILAAVKIRKYSSAAGQGGREVSQ